MPLALVSDIHGNDTALAHVVAELDQLEPRHPAQIRSFVATRDVELDGGAILRARPVQVAEYAIVMGGSVEFRRTPWQSES